MFVVLNQIFLDDPALFSVWADVDADHLVRAAMQLATEVPLTVAQLYQIVKQASSENRKVEVWTMRRYRDAHQLASSLPIGFVIGTAVVVEDIANPHASAYCYKHSCYFGYRCRVCQGDYL